ncbi:MAG TPA: hypothetical protein VLH19_03400 [Patescibacteria group bacterium]|nr:hypothetical protein [Patescibacteria group bacterium]
MKQYVLLAVVEILLLGGFLWRPEGIVRLWLAIFIGLFYAGFGILTHRKEIRTLKLMLEYLCIGLLATTSLVLLISNL